MKMVNSLKLAGLALLTSLGAVQCTPRTYAKQDYQQFPAFSKSIALHNVQQMLADSHICSGGGYADESGFSCSFTECGRTAGYDSSTCAEYVDQTVSLRWDQIHSVAYDEPGIRIWLNQLSADDHPGYPNRIEGSERKQTKQLYEALQYYLSDRGVTFTNFKDRLLPWQSR